MWISEVADIFPRNLDSSLCFIQSSISHDVLCIEVKWVGWQYTALVYSFPGLVSVCCFAIRSPQFPASQKTWLSGYSDLCKDTPGTQCTIPWEKKKNQWRVFCWLPYVLLPESILSGNFPARNGNQSVYLEKIGKICCCNEHRNDPVCFYCKFMAQLFSFHLEKLFFWHQVPDPRFVKTCFPWVLELCKDTTSIQCTITW